jgi:hypothetical protein
MNNKIRHKDTSWVCEYIVEYRPTAMQWFYIKRPLLGNAHNNSYCWKRGVFYVLCAVAVFRQRFGKHVPVAMDMKATTKEQRFLCGPCWEVMTRTIEVMSSVELCTGGCEAKTWARKAEESPLLEAVAEEQLVKIQQAGKGLVGAVVICELWILAVL